MSKSNRRNEKLLRKIAEHVRVARKKKNLTQQELADKIGTSTEYISVIESRRPDMGVSLFADLVDILDLPVNQIFSKQNTAGDPNSQAIMAQYENLSEKEKHLFYELSLGNILAIKSQRENN